MNILASVYACSPYDGSERAVGWNWICEIEKYHKVWALTSKVYEKDINRYMKQHPNELKNVEFIFIEVSKVISFWHKGYKGERLYYIMWQKCAMKSAKKLMKTVKFDLVHHITYVTCILPTYMHKLGLPFLYGPVAGGEKIPSIINYPMSRKNKILEEIRKLSKIFFCRTNNFRKTIENANLILVTTEETKELIPKKYRDKVEIFQAIGLNEDMFDKCVVKKNNDICKVLIAGRMIHWKGYEIAISAFVKMLESGCKAELTVLGDTDDGCSEYKIHLQDMCGRYLNKEIKFIDRVDHSRMKNFYDEFDILLNCSLRDSGCFVIMEGMSRGLPVVCIDTGGPRVNTINKNSIKIIPSKMDDMISDVSNAISKLVKDKTLREEMGNESHRYAYENFIMSKKMEKINEFYEIISRK